MTSVYALVGLVSQNKPTLVQKFSAVQVYNTLALPVLLYGSEIWTLGKKDETKRLISIEIKYFLEEQQGTPFVTPKEMEKCCKS